MAFKEPFCIVSDFLPLTASLTGDAFQDVNIKISGDSHFEILRMIHKATSSAANLKITNASTGQQIIKPKGDARSVSSTAFNGITANGFTPYNFPKPYMIPADTELLIQAADLSNVSNYFRLAIHGNKVYGGDAPYANRPKRDIFSFTIDSGSVAAYDTNTKTYILDSAAGFLVSKLTGSRTDTGLVFIKDIRPWSSSDVHFDNMVGNSQFGNVLTSKRWIPEKTVLTVRFTDLSGSANRFKITFSGERVPV
jgi:hypothetical protein